MEDLEQKRIDSMIGKIHTFRGQKLPQYAAGHRALVFGVVKRTPHVESPMLVWLVLYVLIRPIDEAVKTCTSENPWQSIMEFANSFDPSVNEEASLVVSEIFDEVKSARVETVSTDGEKKP